MGSSEYTNQHLQEVVCGFSFTGDDSSWDSVYFGQYFDKIKLLGFVEREERQGLQIDFLDDSPDTDTYSHKSTHRVDYTMLFKHTSKGWGISIGRNQISFHVVRNYSGWENFVTDVIEPGMDIYQQIGLLKGKVRCSIAYLNRFRFRIERDLSDYFSSLIPTGTTFGEEIDNYIQKRLMFNEQLTLIMRLTSALNENKTEKHVTLECGSITSEESQVWAKDWRGIISTAHQPLKGFFDSLITNKLKSLL